MTFSIASSASCNERRMCAVDTPSHQFSFVICHRHRARPILSKEKKKKKKKLRDKPTEIVSLHPSLLGFAYLRLVA